MKDYGLGMSQGKASHILMKDILWKLIVQTDNFRCHHCQEPMTRETFSVEHKVPWRFSMKHTPTQKEIVAILNESRKAGSFHLCGSREERKAQLKALRCRDFLQEGKMGRRSEKKGILRS